VSYRLARRSYREVGVAGIASLKRPQSSVAQYRLTRNHLSLWAASHRLTPLGLIAAGAARESGEAPSLDIYRAALGDDAM